MYFLKNHFHNKHKEFYSVIYFFDLHLHLQRVRRVPSRAAQSRKLPAVRASAWYVDYDLVLNYHALHPGSDSIQLPTHGFPVIWFACSFHITSLGINKPQLRLASLRQLNRLWRVWCFGLFRYLRDHLFLGVKSERFWN